MPSSLSLRWLAVSVFVLSSTLNYLDRSLINTLAPLIMAEFHLDLTGFGVLISAFSISYAISSLGAGWVLDRFGVTRGISAAVSWWSAAAICTGLVSSVPLLALCRGALGIGESAGVPAVGKLNGIYLKPEERALGAAVNQIGLTLAAPLAALWIGFATVYGWRWPFIVTGLCGFLWMPIWWVVSRRIPPQYLEERQEKPSFAILRDRNLIILVIANVLWMGGYSLWSNWITIYLTHVQHLTLAGTAKFVWIPPLVSNIGGFFGGWLSLRWMRQSIGPISARRKAVWLSAAGCLLTLLLPFAASAASATAVMSVSFFFLLSGSVNIYALPIDIFGAKHSGLAIAALTCSFGLLQTVISPVIGYLSGHHMYNVVIWLVAIPPLVSAAVLSALKPTDANSLNC